MTAFWTKWVEAVRGWIKALIRRCPPLPPRVVRVFERAKEWGGEMIQRIPPLPPWAESALQRVESLLDWVRKQWPEPPSFKECLKLAIPALVIGTIVRLAFFITVPETYWGEDTQGYWDAARELKYDDELQFEAKRRYIYPIFIMLITQVPFVAPVYSISFIQHVVGVLTIIPFVYILRAAIPKSRIAVIICSVFFALWYKNLNYENEVAGETFFLGFSIAFTAFAIAVGSRQRGRRNLFWMFLFAALSVGTKPVGKMIWLGGLAVALIFSGNPLKWSRQVWAALVLGGFFFAFVGQPAQSKWLLLSSVLPLVPTEGKAYPVHREALVPFIEYSRTKGDEYPWFQGTIKKTLIAKADEEEWWDPASGEPAPEVDPSVRTRIYHKEWQMMLREKEQAEPFGKLAKEGILAQPFQFVNFTFSKMISCWQFSAKVSRLQPDRFWDNQIRYFEDMSESRMQCFEMFLREPVPKFQDRLERHQDREGRTGLIHTIAWIGKTLKMTHIYDHPQREAPGFRLGWFGWAAMVGLVIMTLFWLRTGIIALLPAWAVVGASFAVGDRVSRYAIASDWLLLIAGFAGMAGLIWLIGRNLQRFIHRRKVDQSGSV